jgi:type VI secretion system protein ImpH
VRLAQEPYVTFAASTITGLRRVPGRSTVRLRQAFLGMFGPNGPLPLHLTEYARDRVRDGGDATFARFMDVFHHRMISFFYRAWAESRPAVSYDRRESDRFAVFVGSLFGIGMPSFRRRDTVPDNAKLHYAGWLSSHAKNADGLESMLQDFFQVPVRIEEFQGQWVELDDAFRFQLGQNSESSTLGVNSIVGSHVWDCQQKFRIVLGPLTLEQYERFLPGENSLSRLTALVRNYVGDELQWDLELVLKKQETPSLGLGEYGHLGWTDWIISEEPRFDPHDLALDPAVPVLS